MVASDATSDLLYYCHRYGYCLPTRLKRILELRLIALGSLALSVECYIPESDDSLCCNALQRNLGSNYRSAIDEGQDLSLERRV